jgi:integrase
MPKRRGHNDCSIHQRQIDGRWVASMSLPIGKRKSLYGKTRADVKFKLTQAIKEQDRGFDLNVKSETVAQFLTRWLARADFIRHATSGGSRNRRSSRRRPGR